MNIKKYEMHECRNNERWIKNNIIVILSLLPRGLKVHTRFCHGDVSATTDRKPRKKKAAVGFEHKVVRERNFGAENIVFYNFFCNFFASFCYWSTRDVSKRFTILRLEKWNNGLVWCVLRLCTRERKKGNKKSTWQSTNSILNPFSRSGKKPFRYIHWINTARKIKKKSKVFFSDVESVW